MVETRFIEACQSLLLKKISNFAKLNIVMFVNRPFVKDHLPNRNVSSMFYFKKVLLKFISMLTYVGIIENCGL